MPRQRLDVILVERGFFESRNKAAAAVIAGDIQLANGGRRVQKPGQMFEDDVDLIVAERDRYVSRGGIKIENAFKAFTQIDVTGRRALDAGASTGGFTDYLLQHGAAHVIAVDVAYGELHMKLRDDDRVTVVERKNVRELVPGELEYEPDLLVADLSFIAISKVFPVLRPLMADAFDAVVLVKPQFEVGRERVGKGGVVRDPDVRVDAVVEAGEAAVAAGFVVLGVCSSGLPGPAGNLEWFLWLGEDGREGIADLRAAAQAIEDERR
jgi:23S rRNA (cytidine1920-2'-O)/16S rRNA (cytidine1409-2'-O)-methyltransferase